MTTVWQRAVRRRRGGNLNLRNGTNPLAPLTFSPMAAQNRLFILIAQGYLMHLVLLGFAHKGSSGGGGGGGAGGGAAPRAVLHFGLHPPPAIASRCQHIASSCKCPAPSAKRQQGRQPSDTCQVPECPLWEGDAPNPKASGRRL